MLLFHKSPRSLSPNGLSQTSLLALIDDRKESNPEVEIHPELDNKITRCIPAAERKVERTKV